jgi:hypothetical protein
MIGIKSPLVLFSALSLFTIVFSPMIANADQASTVAALRMSGTITGGALPTSSAQFTQMVGLIQSGNYYGAAMVAINTPYFAQYLVRRMAKEMQSPSMTETGIPDNDATTFIVANLIGSGTAANISKLWSDNATYLINVGGTNMNTSAVSAAQLAAVNWQTDLVRVPGQTAVIAINSTTNPVTVTRGPIDTKHVGGYFTLSTKVGDNSIAMYGGTAGTNLRWIEALYETTMGLTLPELVIMDKATAQVVPRFVPENDPNFFVGTGQPACMSCHGGGVSNLTHGYSTLANMFDYDGQFGLRYFNTAVQTTGTQKSLGSVSGNRSSVLKCDFKSFTTCNPDSEGADANQTWDLTTWQQGGLLALMQWNGPVTGEGLNSLSISRSASGLGNLSRWSDQYCKSSEHRRSRSNKRQFFRDCGGCRE